MKKFQNLIKTDNVYRILLRFFSDVGLENLLVKSKMKLIFTIQTNMNKLFETNFKKATIPTEPDVEIIFHSSIYIQYEQIKLNGNFRTYLETMMISEDALRTGIKKHLVKNCIN